MRNGLCILAALLLAVPAAGQQQVEELRGQEFQPVPTRRTQEARQPVPELEAARALLEADQPKAAFQTALDWTLANRTHPSRDQGLLLMSRGLYGHGNPVKAFYYLDELMDTYPASPYFYDALQLQYDMAEALLDGYKLRALGLPLVNATGVGEEMMQRVQQRSPGSPLAERALLRTADFYMREGQYDIASDAYRSYLESYPRSRRVPEVRVRRILANVALYAGPPYDPTPLLDARAQARELLADDPALANAERMPELLTWIDEQMGAKLLNTAEYYERVNKPAAARKVLRDILRVLPETPAAETARRRLGEADTETTAPETPPEAE